MNKSLIGGIFIVLFSTGEIESGRVDFFFIAWKDNHLLFYLSIKRQ